MSETLHHPTVVIEGRALLPNQLVTRQTYLPAGLAAEGVRTLFVAAEDPNSYDASGRIRSFTPYGTQEPVTGVIEPGKHAWRLRDVVWPDGDKAAYPAGHGYNSELARTELATRQGFATALGEMGLGAHGVELFSPSDTRGWQPDGMVFVKPTRISDISERPGTRARLVRADELERVLGESFADGVVLQKQESTLSARVLLDHLGIASAPLDPSVEYLHALRVFAPLWLPPHAAPAVELRLTDPRTDVGKFFATQQHLLEPEHVRERLPQLAELHHLLHEGLATRYGQHNYLTLDYLIGPDGSVKVLNGLVRGLTPNLENQSPEVRHLANATADVEVGELARLALKRFHAR